MTTTLDKEYVHACIHSPRNLSEKWNSNENTEDNLLSCCASIKGKIVPSSGQDQKLKGWTKKLGNALRGSVAAFHQERILTWIKERFPTERRYSERIQRTITVKAQVHLYFVLYSLFYTVSSTLFSFHFPQIVFFLCSVSILWFLLYPKTPFSSVLFCFPAGTQYHCCISHSTDLSCWPHSINWIISTRKYNSFHKMRSRVLWTHEIFQGVQVLPNPWGHQSQELQIKCLCFQK